MNTSTWSRISPSMILISIILIGCQPGSIELEEVSQISATVVEKPSVTVPLPTLVPSLTPSPVPSKTLAPVPTRTATQPVATVSPVAEVERLYLVAFVEEDDQLNVRKSANVDDETVYRLVPGTRDISVAGPGERVGNSTWLQIESDGISGWVNSRYLVEQVDGDVFCDSVEVSQLLDQFLFTLMEGDGSGLIPLVEGDRGMRFRRHWWNQEVVIEHDALQELFEDVAKTYWGIADGSGEPINGSFSDIVLPLLERNLFAASESACNEILHGGSAGYIILPPEYEGINFYSLYRPSGPDDFELDWGTWVVGIERWQGTYYISYLVHFEWEI